MPNLITETAINALLAKLGKTTTALAAAESLCSSSEGLNAITPEFIRKLSASSAIVIALALRNKKDGQELLASNPEIIIELLKINPETSQSIALALIETDSGRELLSSKAQLCSDIITASSNESTRNLVERIIGKNIPSEQAGTIKQVESWGTALAFS